MRENHHKISITSLFTEHNCACVVCKLVLCLFCQMFTLTLSDGPPAS